MSFDKIKKTVLGVVLAMIGANQSAAEPRATMNENDNKIERRRERDETLNGIREIESQQEAATRRIEKIRQQKEINKNRLRVEVSNSLECVESGGLECEKNTTTLAEMNQYSFEIKGDAAYSDGVGNSVTVKDTQYNVQATFGNKTYQVSGKYSPIAGDFSKGKGTMDYEYFYKTLLRCLEEDPNVNVKIKDNRIAELGHFIAKGKQQSY